MLERVMAEREDPGPADLAYGLHRRALVAQGALHMPQRLDVAGHAVIREDRREGPQRATEIPLELGGCPFVVARDDGAEDHPLPF